ncbi:MAG TPA: efflux RND transporter periplasmic adaptor subunit [Planctomycetaceae bacterium]|nr:efflux RND transporter periplasmic adaptor subunit [Planctomycetaceae bacterium]
MSASVNLRELAFDRGDAGRPQVRIRRHVLTRYVLPLVLACGFLSLVAWASWDIMFPPQSVTVIPVFSATSVVQQEGTPLFKAAGWIEPRPTDVRVTALAPGVVEQLLVVEDQFVHAGDVIAELVKADARLVYERTLADLHLREAELAESQATLTAAVTRFSQPVHLQAALGEAEAMLAKIQTQLRNLPFESRRAEADHEAARKNYEGKSSARDVIAAIQIDVAKGKLDSFQALVEELQNRKHSLTQEQTALTQRRDALKTQLELLADEIRAKDEAEARLKAAEARVEQVHVTVAEAKLQLDRMTIHAPIDGRVFRLVANPGTRVGGGISPMLGSDASTVVTMYDPQMLQLRVDVRFEDVPRVCLDQQVEIDNPALETAITGKVLFISSEANIQKNTLQVKVEIPDPPSVFKPEMLVDVTFVAPPLQEKSAEPGQELKLYVLQQLIQQGEGGSFVWIADQSEGTARKVAVQTGAAGNNGLVEIKSGVTIASRIISGGTDGLRDGDRIRITGEDATLGTAPSAETSDRSKSLNRLPGESNHVAH